MRSWKAPYSAQEARCASRFNVVQAEPERHLWAESYEFDQQDVLAVQSDVARGVARQIRVKVDAARSSAPRYVPTCRSGSLRSLPSGSRYSYKGMARARTSWTRAKEYLRKRLRKIPATLRPMRVWRYSTCTTEGFRRETLRNAFRSGSGPKRRSGWTTHSLKHTPLSPGHTAGVGLGRRRARVQAAPSSSIPSYPLAHIWFAQYLSAMQRSEEAVTQAKRAQQWAGRP